MTSSWFFLSTLNYDARSTTHQIILVSCNSVIMMQSYIQLLNAPCSLTYAQGDGDLEVIPHLDLNPRLRCEAMALHTTPKWRDSQLIKRKQFSLSILIQTDAGSRVVKGVRMGLFVGWKFGFEFRRGHEYLSLVTVDCIQL